MGDTAGNIEDTIMDEIIRQFDEKPCAFYPEHYRPSQQDYLTELRTIRSKIKSLKATDELSGKALDDILGKHDELIAKRQLAIREEKVQSRALVKLDRVLGY